MSSDAQLRQHALAIWQAGVEAVKPARLFSDKVLLKASRLCIEDVEIDLTGVRRLIVVGAGKASAAMASALQQTVLSNLSGPLHRLPIQGWINVPEGTFSPEQAKQLEPVHLHAARPAGLNSPTAAAIFGTAKILELVRHAAPEDLVICLLSGGGSALLVAPRPGVTLEDKQAVAHEISAAGGNIQQLNQVRRALSEVKGGGLARACKARRMLSLIVSDVLGDPLETIASGPTLAEAAPQPQQAWDTLESLSLAHLPSLARVAKCLQRQIESEHPQAGHSSSAGDCHPSEGCRVDHVILGNNADAIDAAGAKAVQLGYRYVMHGATRMEGDVLQVASLAVAAIEQLRSQAQIDCWISGGEPTVVLPAEGAGQGGRNQQLALAVLHEFQCRGWPANQPDLRPFVFVSGGTDGEDGPTDAAGARIDAEVSRRAQSLGLDARAYLQRADAYGFFEQSGGLLRTGQTGTNVCDLRVALVGK